MYYYAKKYAFNDLYDTGFIKTDQLATEVIVIMIHGLTETWKQLLAYFL